MIDVLIDVLVDVFIDMLLCAAADGVNDDDDSDLLNVFGFPCAFAAFFFRFFFCFCDSFAISSFFFFLLRSVRSIPSSAVGMFSL